MEHKWYVVHTYSGYEARVVETLRDQARRDGLEDHFGEILVPMEQQPEGAEGRKATKKFFPGYIFVEMTLNKQTWHLVNNTPRVTGFVGGGSEPGKVRPLPEREVARLRTQIEDGTPAPASTEKYEVGEKVRVKQGPFASFTGVVDEVSEEKGKLWVLVSIFGRATRAELNFSEVEKL